MADGAVNPWIAEYYENTIVCYSWSKSLSLAGERVGYVWVPGTVRHAERVYDAILGAQRVTATVMNSLFNRVIEKCVDLPAPVEEYDRKRKKLLGGLEDIGYDVVHPEGAFYLWVRALESPTTTPSRRARPTSSGSRGGLARLCVPQLLPPELLRERRVHRDVAPGLQSGCSSRTAATPGSPRPRRKRRRRARRAAFRARVHRTALALPDA